VCGLSWAFGSIFNFASGVDSVEDYPCLPRLIVLGLLLQKPEQISRRGPDWLSIAPARQLFKGRGAVIAEDYEVAPQ
jgi:hypothetical protein